MNDTSTTQLEIYASLSRELAGLKLGEGKRVLQASDFPAQIAERSMFDGLVIDRPMSRWVGDADPPTELFEILDRAHGHDWYAEAEGYRRIGLWLFHLLFSGRRFAGLDLCHTQTKARTLWVVLEPMLPEHGFLTFDAQPRAVSYTYHPAQPVRHPFADFYRIHNETDRPMFRFGWTDPTQRYQGDPHQADQIILSLTHAGLVEFACLLLDFALPESTLNEINLETPFIGYAGTRPLSLEARFWLPGSFGFYCDSLDQLTLPEAPQAQHNIDAREG